MKYFVYVLRSLKDGMRYIGYTSDLERRLQEHNFGLARATLGRQPMKLVHAEEYDDRKIAKAREKFLKSGKGREFLDSKNI